MNPPLITALNLPIKGASPAVLRACKMVIGIELSYLKRELGYEGAGRRASFLEGAAADERPTWSEFCWDQARIKDDTAKNYLGTATALKNRLTTTKWKDAKWLLGQMEKRPSEMTDGERSNLIEWIASAIPDSPAKHLLKELRAVEACDIPDSLPEARAKVIRSEAILKVMKEELRERERAAQVRLVMKTLSGMKAAGTLQRLLNP